MVADLFSPSADVVFSSGNNVLFSTPRSIGQQATVHVYKCTCTHTHIYLYLYVSIYTHLQLPTHVGTRVTYKVKGIYCIIVKKYNSHILHGHTTLPYTG